MNILRDIMGHKAKMGIMSIIEDEHVFDQMENGVFIPNAEVAEEIEKYQY